MLSDQIERLKKVPFLGMLDDRALEIIIFNCQEFSAADGTTVYFEGDPADGALFLTQGEISLNGFKADKMVEYVRVASGGLVDVYALISKKKRSLTAKAMGNISYLLLDRKTFLKIMESYPDLAEKMQDYLREDVKTTVSSLNSVAARLEFIK